MKKQTDNLSEVELGKLQKRAERLDKIRDNRIIDCIPGLNTAPTYCDTRDAKQTEFISRERIEREERSDKNFRERQHRINVGMMLDTEVQRIMKLGLKVTRPTIVEPKGNPALAEFTHRKIVEAKKIVKEVKKEDSQLIKDETPITDWLRDFNAKYAYTPKKKV